MKLRIVLLPDEAGNNFAKNLSAEIAEKVETDFILDETHISHVTVLALDSQNEDFQHLTTLLQKKSKQFQGLESTAKVIVQKSDLSYIGLYFDEKITVEVNKIRQVLLTQIHKMDDVKNLFLDNPAPHLTLTHLVHADDSNIVEKNFTNETGEMSLGYLALAIEGESFGTCRQIIQKYELTN